MVFLKVDGMVTLLKFKLMFMNENDFLHSLSRTVLRKSDNIVAMHLIVVMASFKNNF